MSISPKINPSQASSSVSVSVAPSFEAAAALEPTPSQTFSRPASPPLSSLSSLRSMAPSSPVSIVQRGSPPLRPSLPSGSATVGESASLSLDSAARPSSPSIKGVDLLSSRTARLRQLEADINLLSNSRKPSAHMSQIISELMRMADQIDDPQPVFDMAGSLARTVAAQISSRLDWEKLGRPFGNYNDYLLGRHSEFYKAQRMRGQASGVDYKGASKDKDEDISEAERQMIENAMKASMEGSHSKPGTAVPESEASVFAAVASPVPAPVAAAIPPAPVAAAPVAQKPVFAVPASQKNPLNERDLLNDPIIARMSTLMLNQALKIQAEIPGISFEERGKAIGIVKKLMDLEFEIAAKTTLQLVVSGLSKSVLALLKEFAISAPGTEKTAEQSAIESFETRILALDLDSSDYSAFYHDTLPAMLQLLEKLADTPQKYSRLMQHFQKNLGAMGIGAPSRIATPQATGPASGAPSGARAFSPAKRPAPLAIPVASAPMAQSVWTSRYNVLRIKHPDFSNMAQDDDELFITLLRSIGVEAGDRPEGKERDKA